jgi:hypothetical protein
MKIEFECYFCVHTAVKYLNVIESLLFTQLFIFRKLLRKLSLWCSNSRLYFQTHNNKKKNSQKNRIFRNFTVKKDFLKKIQIQHIKSMEIVP